MINYCLLTAVLMLLSPAAFTQDRDSAPPLARCDCKTFTITPSLAAVKGGEIVEFGVMSEDPLVLGRQFSWTVSAGTIVSGQGTNRVSVQTSEDMAKARPFPPFFSSARPGTLITAIAKYANTDCTCPGSVATVRVGYRSEPTNRFPDVTDLRLSNTKLVLECAPGVAPRSSSLAPTGMSIDLVTSAFDPENDVLIYDYKVSGGRIVGTGAKVKWDLSGVKPGAYSITAVVDDGCGLCGATKTQIVTVAECDPGCGLIECPSITLDAVDDPDSSGNRIFTAKVSGGAQQSVTYKWAVVNGEIVGGQGTPSIAVKLSPTISDRNLSVTITIGGTDPLGSCSDSVTEDFFEGRKRP